MWSQRNVTLPVLALLVLLLGAAPGMASDDSDIRVRGFADVPAGGLLLPLPADDPPVTINVTFGIPSLTIPVQITPSTKIKSEFGTPVRLVVGDAVKVKMVLAGNVLRASRLEVEAFPELELTGLAKGLPATGVALPLDPGTTLDFIVSLGSSGVDIPVRVTASTKVHHAPLTIRNGDVLRVEAVVRSGFVVATGIKEGPGPDDDD